jgi:hypothetical protein
MKRDDLKWAAAGLAVSALFWIDPLFLPLALIGPIVVGAVVGARRLGVRTIVVLWLVAGLGAVISDFVVNREDVVFHLVLTVLMVALAVGAWWGAGAIARGRRAYG